LHQNPDTGERQTKPVAGSRRGYEQRNTRLGKTEIKRGKTQPGKGPVAGSMPQKKMETYEQIEAAPGDETHANRKFWI
jgi:hypothetical protein